MGCKISKIEREESVSCCKRRVQFMKQAITARNKFAAAHSNYVKSLKNTGAALSDYALGEVESVCGGGDTKHSNSNIEEDVENESTNNLKHRKRNVRGSAGSDTECTEEEVLQKPPSPMPQNECCHDHPAPCPHWDYLFETDYHCPFQTDVPVERKMREERAKKSEKDGESDGGREEEHVEEGTVDIPSPSNTNLVTIFCDLDDLFLKSSESAHGIPRLLEAPNFADKRDDGVDYFDYNKHQTNATVLDKMLAWEEKLYDEVKAGEQMKFQYQKKVASLKKMKKRGSHTCALERMNASVSYLQTRRIVDMESKNFKVAEIKKLRDGQLHRKLVVFFDVMATMWKSMTTYHGKQNMVVQDLRNLDISKSLIETSDLHHERTRRLCDDVKEWHSHFSELVSQQKEYVKALNNWAQLNLIPLRGKVSSLHGTQNPPIHILLHTWHEYLKKIPDEHTNRTISNSAAMFRTILQNQKEELDLRNKCAESRKKHTRRAEEYDNWHKRCTHADRALLKNLISERQQHVLAAEMKFKCHEEAYRKKCEQVRLESLKSLKSNLPVLFQAMLDFSHACSGMYSNLKSVKTEVRIDG